MLTSNLKTVIRQLERYQTELPAYVARAMAPAVWSPRLLGAARTVLQGLAASEEEEPGELAAFVPAILDTFRGYLAGPVARYEMLLNPSRTAGFPVDLRRAMTGGRDPGGELVSAEKNLEAAREAVRDWVYEKKDLSEREHADPDAAVLAMWEILGLVPRKDGVYSPRMAEAAQDLVPHILDYVAAKPGGAGGLDAARAQRWATAVLLTWRELVEAELPAQLRQQLNALRRHIQNTML